MRDLRLVLHQFRYDLVEFSQNAQSRSFTLALPVLMMALLIAILGSHPTLGDTGIPTLTTYYVPSMLAFGVVWASVVNLAVNVTVARERGVLKRRRAAPVPPWVVISARALTAVILSMLVAVIVVLFGAIAYGVDLPVAKVPAVAIAVLVGSASFCALGYALVGFIRTEDAALPVTLGIVLPLYFISGIFIEWLAIPDLLRTAAGLFPVRHLAAAMLTPFDSHSTGAAIAAGDLLVVLGWGLAGFAIATWRFSWEPRGM